MLNGSVCRVTLAHRFPMNGKGRERGGREQGREKKRLLVRVKIRQKEVDDLRVQVSRNRGIFNKNNQVSMSYWKTLP